MALAVRSKDPAVDQSATIILKSISGGKILSLLDMHGNGLRFRIM